MEKQGNSGENDKNLEKMDASSLRHFECPVCMEYFQKPIYQCPTGHSLCSNCKAKIEKCPYCAQTFSCTRNFALENLLTAIKVECKNEHCTKIIPLYMYTQHQNQCPYRNVKCKYANCTWADHKLLVNEHIRKVHGSHVVQKFEKLLSHQFTACFIEHNDYFFYIHRHTDEKITWTAQPTIPININNLFLVVKIISHTGNRYTLRQPILNYMDELNKAKEQSVICMLKSKSKGCEFQLSIVEEI